MTAKPQADRTPGPYQFGSSDSFGRDARVVAYINGDGRKQVPVAQCGLGPMADANAAFIVLACNAYDRDQKTIQELRDALHKIAYMIDDPGHPYDRALAAREALARLDKGTQD